MNHALTAYPSLKGAVIHSGCGSQYTSDAYRRAIEQYGILQSMNSAGGRCHDNARCESMWARMKSELLYDRYDTEQMTLEQLKSLIWRYFRSYWNNRRICSANGGLPPAVKRKNYYDACHGTAGYRKTRAPTVSACFSLRDGVQFRKIKKTIMAAPDRSPRGRKKTHRRNNGSRNECKAKSQ